MRLGQDSPRFKGDPELDIVCEGHNMLEDWALSKAVDTSVCGGLLTGQSIWVSSGVGCVEPPLEQAE